MSKLKELDLRKLQRPYIDLSKYDTEIQMYGNYSGPPIIVKFGQVDQRINVDELLVQTEQGFIFKLLECHGFELIAGNLQSIGGIQVIGDIDLLKMKNVHVRQGDVGLHMTQHHGTETYGKIMLEGCSFNDCDHEGLYIGKFAEDEIKEKPEESIIYPKSKLIEVLSCDFLRNGWDGFQGAHSKYIKLKDCVMAKNGTRKNEWQGKDFILNPGVHRCDLVDSVVAGAMQISGTTKFFRS